MLVNSPMTVRLPSHYHRFCFSFGPLFCNLLFSLAYLLSKFAFFLQSCFYFSEADALILLFELQRFTLLFALNAFSARHFEPAFVASAWCRSKKGTFFSKDS